MTRPPTSAPRPAPQATPGTTGRLAVQVISDHSSPYLIQITAPVRPERRTWLLPTLAVLLIAVVAGSAYTPPPPRTLPEALVGAWRSDAPSHADRRLVLTRDMIAIGTGSAYPTPHLVTGVVTRQRADSTVLEITYREGMHERDGTTMLRLAWLTGTPDALVIRGVPGQWVRAR